MKPTAITDLRMRLLKRALGQDSLLGAIGLMEATWQFAAARFPDGVIPLDQAPMLCAFVDLDTDCPQDLLEALATSGWGTMNSTQAPLLEALTLNDWEENMPAHVMLRNRMRKSRSFGPKLRNGCATVALQDATNGQGVVENASYSATVAQQGERGEGGYGVSERDARREDTEQEPLVAKPLKKQGAKPPAKARKPPLSVDDVTIPDALNGIVVYQALVTWFDYRRKKGCPYKDKGWVDGLFDQFIDLPHEEFAAAVRFSMASGYQALVRPHERDSRATNKRPALSKNLYDNLQDDP